MKLRNIFKIAICTYMAIALLLCVIPTFPAVAEAETSTTLSTYANGGNGNFIYPETTSFAIVAGPVNTVTYSGYYGLFGSEGVVVLRFTNTSTGDFKSWTFVCDGTQYTRSLGYSLPAGSYRITLVDSTVDNFSYLNVNLSYR